MQSIIRHNLSSIQKILEINKLYQELKRMNYFRLLTFLFRFSFINQNKSRYLYHTKLLTNEPEQSKHNNTYL